MMTEKDYCDYETCVALKELGYKESCFGHYFKTEFCIDMPPKYYQSDRYVSAPTLYEVQKWMRENHNIHISTKPYPNEGGLMWMFEIRRFSPYLVSVIVNKTGFYDSEEALLEGIKTVVKYIQEGKYE